MIHLLASILLSQPRLTLAFCYIKKCVVNASENANENTQLHNLGTFLSCNCLMHYLPRHRSRSVYCTIPLRICNWKQDFLFLLHDMAPFCCLESWTSSSAMTETARARSTIEAKLRLRGYVSRHCESTQFTLMCDRVSRAWSNIAFYRIKRRVRIVHHRLRHPK